jgi:hypothetical protein
LLAVIAAAGCRRQTNPKVNAVAKDDDIRLAMSRNVA